jgi:hypothetical protein
VGKPEEKRQLGRPKRRWVNNIRMDLGEVGWGNVEWIGTAQDTDRSSSECVNEFLGSKNPGKLSSGSTTGGLSSSAQFRRVSWLVS